MTPGLRSENGASTHEWIAAKRNHSHCPSRRLAILHATTIVTHPIMMGPRSSAIHKVIAAKLSCAGAKGTPVSGHFEDTHRQTTRVGQHTILFRVYWVGDVCKSTSSRPPMKMRICNELRLNRNPVSRGLYQIASESLVDLIDAHAQVLESREGVVLVG